MQDAAIVCRYCGKEINNNERKESNQIILFILNLFGTFGGILFTYFFISIILGLVFDINQTDMSTSSAILYYGAFVVIHLIARSVRPNYLSNEEKEAEKNEEEWINRRWR